MKKSNHSFALLLGLLFALVLAPASAAGEWRAPNVQTIFSGSTFGNGQSQNMGPALRHTLEEYCESGSCQSDGDDCDTLRFGLTMYPAVDGRPYQCGWGDDVNNVLVAAREDGCFDVGSNLQQMQNRDGRDYCDQSASSWQYEPLDEVVRMQREATFAEAYDSNPGVSPSSLATWWERANINLVMLENMPQTSDIAPGDRVINSLREACTGYDGHGGQFPSMPTFVLGMKNNSADVSLYGGLLAAAGGTGQCCYKPDGCDISVNDATDICAHIEDGRTERDIRDDITAGNYECGGSAKLTVTGAPDTRTLPNLECALAGKKCSGAFAPNPPTNFFNIFACIQVRPRDVPADRFGVRYCHDDELNCRLLTQGGGLQWVDENKTLFYLEGVNLDGTSYCSALGDGEADYEVWDCPNEGNRCDTGLPGRCGVGEISCTGGREVCVQTLAPMPEVCNGLDDDCDGADDNLSDSWDDFSHRDPTQLASYDSDGIDRTGIHCYERDVCRCGGGSFDHAGPGYDTYIMSWQPGICECGEGLSEPSVGGYTPAPSADASQPRAGCSAAPGRPAGGLALLVIMLMGGAAMRGRFD